MAEHFARGKPGDDKLGSLLAALSGSDQRKEAAAAVLTGLVQGAARQKRTFTADQRAGCWPWHRGCRPRPGGN